MALIPERNNSNEKTILDRPAKVDDVSEDLKGSIGISKTCAKPKLFRPNTIGGTISF